MFWDKGGESDNNKIKFNFDWRPTGVDYIDNNCKTAAKKLVEMGLVTVDQDLNEDGKVVIRHPGLCKKKSVDSAISEGLLTKTPHTFSHAILPNNRLNRVCPDRQAKTDKKKICKVDSCSVILAGYFYYLEKRLVEKTPEVKIEKVKETKPLLNKETEIDVYEASANENRLDTLNAISYNEDMYHSFLPLASANVSGCRCAFVGNEGTDKEGYINKIAKWLFAANKISSVTPKRFSLEKLPQSFAESTLYVIDGLSSCYEIIEDDDSFSEKMREQQRDMRRELEKLIKAPKTRYIILDTTALELKRFFAVNPKLPLLYDQIVTFDDLSSEEIADAVYKRLPDSIKTTEENKAGLLKFLNENKRTLPFKNTELSEFLSHYMFRLGRFSFPEQRNPSKSLQEMLENIIGMDNIKKQLFELEKYLNFRQQADKLGITIPDFNLHMMFLGNPGTGKTTVARMVAKILFDLGYVAENKLIEVSEKDMFGQYMGYTALKTNKIIQRALGGVLFIDEAYSLASKTGSGEQAIAVIVKAMEDYKGDLVVIFAGYSKEMQEFVNMNSGISSRIGYTMEFADYTEDELYRMFLLKAKNSGVEIHENAKEELTEMMQFGRNRKNFGNGRFVDNMFQKTLIKHANNNPESKIIDETDIPTIDDVLAQASGERKPESIAEDFEDIIGLQKIKDKVLELKNYIVFRQKASKIASKTLPPTNLHMLFTGDAGTGKTTMARKITKMLYDTGAIRMNKLVEVDRKDLVAEYIGQTAPKVEKVVQGALGGVLFIDEAYALTPKDSARDFGQEAIATLIKAMEDHKDELVVIFAGYTKEMKDFVNSNSGIASRIGYTFEFENYTDDELYAIFEIKAKKYSFTISEQAEIKIKEVIKYYSSVKNFGNGRFVDKLFQETTVKHAQNVSDEISLVLEGEDVPTIEEMVEITFTDFPNLILPKDITYEDRKAIAIHELGHAVSGHVLLGEAGIKVITVIPEGTGALGYVLYDVEKRKKAHWYKKDYLNRIMVSLAGRAAEELFVGDVSSGCSSDVEKATDTAKRMCCHAALGDSLGLISSPYDKVKGNMQNDLNAEIKKTLDECYENIKKVLLDNKEMFDKVLDYLMDKGTITGEEFVDLVKGERQND